GPVLPLTASGSDRSGDLLGAGDHSTQTTSDPVAAKVLGRGGTLAAPAGRADDFSWPRPGSDAIARPEISREPAPDTSEKPSSAAKGNAKNQADANKDAKEKPGAPARGSRRTDIITTTPDDIPAAGNLCN